MSYDQTQPVPPPQGYPEGNPPYPTPYAPPPYPVPAVPGAGGFSTKLGLVGWAAALGGVLILVFFLLPWTSVPTTVNGNGSVSNQSVNGFSAASGVTEFSSKVSVSLFPNPWLVVVCAVALIIIALLISLGRLSARQSARLIIAIAGLALVLELLFLLEINSLNQEIQSNFETTSPSYAVDIGFWLGLLATIPVLLVAGAALRRGPLVVQPMTGD